MDKPIKRTRNNNNSEVRDSLIKTTRDLNRKSMMEKDLKARYQIEIEYHKYMVKLREFEIKMINKGIKL